MAGLVAQNYSDALFSIALEEKQVDVYLKQLQMITSSLQSEKAFASLLAHPKLDKEAKKQMLTSVYGTSIDHNILNFMKLLIDKSRFSHVQEICQVFHDLYNEKYGIQRVFVTSAKPLATQEIAKLKTILETKTQKIVELVIQVDEDLMAGIRVKIGDQIIDNSAKTRLANLKDMVVKSDSTHETR